MPLIGVVLSRVTTRSSTLVCWALVMPESRQVPYSGWAAAWRAARRGTAAAIWTRSTPGVRAVGDRVQLAGGEALVTERVEQRGALAAEHPGDLPADRDHLVAVVRIGGDVHVWQHVVEHREVVYGERADASRSHLAVPRAAILEAPEAVRERRAPHVRE